MMGHARWIFPSTASCLMPVQAIAVEMHEKRIKVTCYLKQATV